MLCVSTTREDVESESLGAPYGTATTRLLPPSPRDPARGISRATDRREGQPLPRSCRYRRS